MTKHSPRELGVGIVGFGWMGRTHAYACRSMPLLYGPLPFRPRLVGVCVRRPETITDAVRLGEFDFGTIRLAELLDRPDIDVISICTPNALHADQVIAAIEAGKHVYCDKPLAVTPAECDRIVAACRARATPPITQVALQYRFYPCTMRARQLIDQGRLGTLLSFRAAYLHASLVDAGKPISWRQRPGAGGGALLDLGSHLLDLLGHLIGPFARVLARRHVHTRQRPDPVTGEPTDVDADDMAVAMLEAAGGAIGTVEVSKLATGVHDELRIELHGDRGAIRLNLADPNGVEFFDHTAADQPIGGDRGFRRLQTIGNYPAPAGGAIPAKLNVGWLSAHVACYYNFLAAVCGTEKAHPTFEDAANLHRLLDAAARSSHANAWKDV